MSSQQRVLTSGQAPEEHVYRFFIVSDSLSVAYSALRVCGPLALISTTTDKGKEVLPGD